MADGRAPRRARRSQACKSDIAFIEQPVDATDLDGMRELRSLGLPVVADESVYSPRDVV